VKLINLCFEGISIVDASVKKVRLCEIDHIEVAKNNHWIGNLSMDTHKLVYHGYRNYTIEKRD